MQSHTVKRRGVNKVRCSDVAAKLLFLCLFTFLFAMQSLAGQNSEAKGQVQGRAFIQDSMGQSYIANAKVTLKGTTVVEAETNEGGKFEFLDVQPGTYTIEVAAPGLAATQVLTVEMGKVAEISLDLKPATVQTPSR